MLSIPLYDSALMFSALILFVIVLIFNVLSRIILIKVERSLGIG
jgi:phosphate transport system permease protein